MPENPKFSSIKWAPTGQVFDIIATNADHAATADSATTATTATTAGSADSATTAGSADYATEAGHAGSADTATTASIATQSTKLTTKRTIDGVEFDGTSNIVHFGVCSTASATAVKEVTLPTGTAYPSSITSGSVVVVKFSYANTADLSSLKLKIGSNESLIYYRGANIPSNFNIKANSVYAFVYDSPRWNIVGDFDTAYDFYAYCSTTASTGTKQVTIDGFKQVTGSMIAINFKYTNTADPSNLKLQVNSETAKQIRYKNTSLAEAGLIVKDKMYFLVYDGYGWQVVGDLDNNVLINLREPTTSTGEYYPTLATGAGRLSLNVFDSFKYKHTKGTTSSIGEATITLGNSTASGTASNEEGIVNLYSSGTKKHTIKGSSITSADVTHTLPAKSGTVLNTGTTSYTQTVASTDTNAYEIGKIKINDSETTIYGVNESNTDTKVTQTTTTDDAFYRILLSNSDSDATETSGAKKASDLAYNANNGLLTVGDGIYYNELQPDGTTYLKRPLIRHGTDNFYIGGTGRLPGSSSDHRDHLGQTYIFTGYDATSGTYNKNLYMCFYNDGGTAFTMVPLWHTLMMRADFTSNTDDWSSAGLRLDEFASSDQFKIIRHMKASGASSYTDVPAWFAGKGGVGLGIKRDGHAGIISFDTNQTWSGTNTTVPTVSFAGGIVDDTNNNYKKPSWYFKLTGTNGATYNLDNFSTTDVKVAQNNTTANAAYRVLLSYSSNDTNETNTARKSSGLTYNPSTGVLGVNGYTVSGTSNSSYNFDDFSTIKRFSTSSNGQDNGWSTIVTSNGLTKLQDSTTSSLYVTRHIPVSGTTVYDPPVWYAAKHSVGLMFANQNQVAIMSMASNNSTPLIKFGATGGGPNGTAVADNIGPANPGTGVGWYFGLTGTTATTYNLDSFSTTDTKVTQTITDGSYNYRILMSYTNSDTTATEGARKASGFYYNPGVGVMTVPTLKLTHTNTSQLLTSLNIRIKPSVIFDYDKLLEFSDYDNNSAAIHLVPSSDGKSSIGHDGIHWASSYINTMNGELNGSISSSTTATTQSDGDNSTKVATTAYVENSLPYYLVRTTENNTSANDWETVLGSSNFDKTRSNYLMLFRHGSTSGTPQSWFAGQQCLGLFMKRTNMAAMISLNTNLAPTTLNYPRVTFAASKHANTSGDGPTATDGWYFSLKGKTASEYDLDDLSLTASSLNNSSDYTTYGLPLMSITPSTNNTAFKIKMSDGFRYSQAKGTTTSEGTAILVLGNGYATGTAGNKTGGVRFYGSGTYYINLKAAAVAANITTWIPKVRAEHSTLTATKVVYELASGVATSVTLNGSNSTVEVATSAAPTYFKVYMRKFRTTSGNSYTLAFYDSVDVQPVSSGTNGKPTTFVLCDSYEGTSPAHATFTGYIKVTSSSGYFKLDLCYSGKKYTLSGTSVTEASLLASEQVFGIYKIVAVYETHE